MIEWYETGDRDEGMREHWSRQTHARQSRTVRPQRLLRIELGDGQGRHQAAVLDYCIISDLVILFKIYG
jgi:hypothetical protein